MMTTSVPCLIPHFFGFLTSKRLHYASFSADDKSNFEFTHHLEQNSFDKTMISKRSCESELRKYGKEARHSHAGNGTHATSKRKEGIEDQKQDLTFCGVGSHHQNGKAENRIKITCNPERIISIHALCFWPKVISQSL